MPSEIVNTVLIVDDDPDETAELTTRLEREGKVVLKAKDDREAREILSRVPCLEKSDYWKFREMIQYSHPSTELCTGDLFRNDKDGSLLVLISPQCDLVDSEMESLCCLCAFPLHEFLPTVIGDKNKRMSILQNRTLRYHSLPAGNDSGRSLILDFASVFTVKRSYLTSGEFTKTATIVSPFRENLVQRYVTYVNRIGTPDIHEKILEQLHDTIVNDRRGT